MTQLAASTLCRDCVGLEDRVRSWANHYASYDPAAWDEALGPHPHLDRTDGNPFRCRACGSCWSLDENPDCGYVYLERLSEAEYRRRLSPSRWAPPFWEGRWGAVVLVYAPCLMASLGLAIAFGWAATREAGGWSKYWPAVMVMGAMALAAGWGLVRGVRGQKKGTS